MTSQPSHFNTIPTIDIAPLMSGDADGAHRIAPALGAAARDVGFLAITGHGCPQETIDALVGAARSFFAQPLEKKMQVYIGRSQNHRGYVPPGEEVFYGGGIDAKEAFDLAIDLPTDDQEAQRFPMMLGPNQWPDLPGFRQSVQAYYDAVFAIGRRLMGGFALALGKPADFFDRQITKPPSQLRLIHYPFDPNAADAAGIGAHTDYECFTLLLPTAPGLEVRNGAGDWIDAPTPPGAFMVNIGDMLELMSGGQFVATQHRVRRVSCERYSFPLFFSLDYDARVAPFTGDLSRPALVAGEHLYAQTVKTFRYLQARAQLRA